jgi:hypothetical protein
MPCCRLAFAGSMGAPSTSQLLSEVKATAAAVGAIGVLVDLLRCEQKMQVQQAIAKSACC